MGTIHITDRGGTVRVRQEIRTLTQAAVAALPAPSIFNSQPWRWRISDDMAELRADRARQSHSLDPDGRFLTISCGIALHHALTTLAARGTKIEIIRFPESHDPDLLARIRILGTRNPDPMAIRLSAVMIRGRVHQPYCVPECITDECTQRLCAVAKAHGARLHVLPTAYDGQGEVSYAVLFTDDNGPTDWLIGGEALSAVLLTAADEGLTASPFSNMVGNMVGSASTQKECTLVGDQGTRDEGQGSSNNTCPVFRHPIITIRW